jgi:hypothetical protein
VHTLELLLLNTFCVFHEYWNCLWVLKLRARVLTRVSTSSRVLLGPWFKCVVLGHAGTDEMTTADGEGPKHKVLRAPEAIAMRFITCGHVCGCQFGTRHGVFQRLPPRCSRTAAKLTSTISRTLDTSWCGEPGCTSMSINVQPFALFKYSRYPAVQLLTSDKRIIKSKKKSGQIHRHSSLATVDKTSIFA